MKIYVAGVETLWKKEREDETQFITKFVGKNSLGHSYFALQNFRSQLHVCWLIMPKLDVLIARLSG